MIVLPSPCTLLAAMELTGGQRMLMMLPLCMSIAIVYKTTRCSRVEDIPRAAARLCVTILVSMAAVGAGLWSLYRLFA